MTPVLPLSVTSQARRAQIVEAATRVIAQEGLARATFGRIATVAGLSSPGMISYHFAHKDELLTTLGRTILQDCGDAVADAVAAAPDPVAGLAAYLTASVRWQDTHRDAVAALVRLSSGWTPPDPATAFDETPLTAPLLEVLSEGQRQGVLRPLPPAWLVRTILCAVEGYHQALAEDESVDAEEFAAALVTLFCDGLRVDG